MADTSGISFSGLSTGIDTDALIKALVQVKRQPIIQLQQRADEEQSIIGRLNDFASKLSALRSAVQALSSTRTFAAFQASTSNDKVVKVTASSAASEGNHNIVVQQLAAAQTSKTNQAFGSVDTAAGLAGTLTITPTGGIANGPAGTVTIAAPDTLEQIRDRINNTSVKAYGAVSFAGVPADGAKLTVDGKTYEFHDTSGGAYGGENILVDTSGLATAEDAAAALAAAATGANKGERSTMTASGAAVSIVADADGSGGNSIAMSETGDDGAAMQLSGATLSGGGAPSYSASIVNVGTSAAPSYSLVLTGKNTGVANGFAASFSVPAQLSFANTQEAKDAILDVDGILGLRRSSNLVSDIVSGTTLSLVSAPADRTPVSIVVTKDTGSITSKVQAFITAYNDLNDYVRRNAGYDANTRTAGPLMGELAVSTVRNGLTGIITSQVEGLTGTANALSRIGITTQADGRLSMDSAKFDAALGNDFQGVVNLFARNLTTNTRGVAYQVMDRIDRWMSPVDGVIARRKSTLQDDIDRIDDQVEQKEAALALYERSLKMKYSNLEQLVSTLRDQSGALSGLIGYYR